MYKVQGVPIPIYMYLVQDTGCTNIYNYSRIQGVPIYILIPGYRVCQYKYLFQDTGCANIYTYSRIQGVPIYIIIPGYRVCQYIYLFQDTGCTNTSDILNHFHILTDFSFRNGAFKKIQLFAKNLFL